MKHEHEPRAHDHLVEPMYHALHVKRAENKDDGGRDPGRERDGDWRWRIVWFVIGALAIGYVVWRQAF